MTTTTPTIPGLEEAIKYAWNERHYKAEPSFGDMLADAMTETAYHFADTLWVRNQACDEVDCPNREEWDRALTAEADEALHAARDEVMPLIRQRMAEFAERFQAEHPEAVLRMAEPSK